MKRQLLKWWFTKGKTCEVSRDDIASKKIPLKATHTRSRVGMLLSFVIGLGAFSQASALPTLGTCPASTTQLVDLNFGTVVNMTGTGVGRSWRYTNVTSIQGQAVDAVTTVTSLTGVTDSYHTGGKSNGAWVNDPDGDDGVVYIPAASIVPGDIRAVEIRLDFVEAGTSIPISLSGEIEFMDIDEFSGSGVESLRIDKSQHDGYFLSTGSNLLASSIGSLDIFTGTQVQNSEPESAVRFLLDTRSSIAFTVHHLATGTSNAGNSGFVFDGNAFVTGSCSSTPTPTPRPYVPQTACGIEGFTETFGSGVGRNPFPNSATTSYVYNDGTNADPLLNYVQDGQYTILDKSSISTAGTWWIIDDDATGDIDGRMLLINADHTSGEFYRQTVSNLTIGKTYSFSSNIANPYNDGDDQDPNVKFSIEAGGIEIASVVTGNIPEDPGYNDINWNKFTLVFTATSTEVDIVLKDEAPNSGVMSGNDVAFDGISLAETCIDYGDAPSTYSTPSHIIDSSIYLGSAIPDAENTAAPSSSATGDDTTGTDDEDGITLPTMTQGETATITITTKAPFVIGLGSGSKPALIGSEGYLQGWIDWNSDGDFNDVSEQIIVDLQDGSASDTDGAVNNQISINIAVPATATTTQTYARFRWSTQKGLDASSQAADGEVEDYKLTILSSSAACTALSGDTNANIAPALHLRSDDKIYLASNSTSDKEGHLKAFTFDSNGTPSSNASWDSALKMDTSERGLELFSTNASGNIVTLNTLDEAAFETNGIPDVATIRAYTLNPAHGSGLYLNGRRDGAFLGTISPNSNLGLLDNSINVMDYLNDTHYRTHYANVISLRSAEANATKPKRVFLSSDDGFLYAFDQYDGDLGWGWMPRSLVKELKDFATFRDNHFMQGHIDVMNLKNTSNNTYATYIIGSYRDGLGQYVLRLDANGDLDKVVWDADYLAQASVMDQAPNHGKRAYFSNESSRVFSAFVTTNINDESTLHIRSLTDDNDNVSIPLSFTATSTPFVSLDLLSVTAPAAKTLYLGSSTADIYAVSLFTNDGSLKTGSQISQSIAKITSLGNGSTSAITYLGISSSADTANYYLRAQSADQLTLFSYDESDSSWDKKWTTYVSGAGKWLTPDATSLTADTDIESLPTGSIITDTARIVAGSVVLPVMHDPSGTACYGDAYYYFYQLEDGHFPAGTFFTSNNGTPISDKLNLGLGNTRTLHLTNLPGKQKLLGMGIADQTSANGTGVNKSFYIKDAISSGIRSWREIR